jgi:hypothetical protein
MTALTMRTGSELMTKRRQDVTADAGFEKIGVRAAGSLF